jgi:hypothetical protein
MPTAAPGLRLAGRAVLALVRGGGLTYNASSIPDTSAPGSSALSVLRPP